VVSATRAGEEERIGLVASRDEIGELAREFDAMLDLLRERKQQIQDWAGQLEDKVESRTAELQRKNDELQHTIRALLETREQLIVAEKLAALGELTAGVAHEINNPTAVMLGNLDVLVDELGPAADPVRQEIDLLIEQVYRIKDIIDNLLQFARPDQYAGDVSRVNVNEVVEQTLALVRHLRKKSRFKIELNLAARQQVQINPKELQQVLVNLVVNAIHALGPREGMVWIATRDWGDEGVVISVRDNGRGMTPEQLGHIFNPFYSTKRQEDGTGLGLSVSYSIIRRYGGNINVESEPAKGSEFSVRLLAEPKPIEDEKIITDQLRAFDGGRGRLEVSDSGPNAGS
jgi:two-component system NtrC family sensor kinase